MNHKDMNIIKIKIICKQCSTVHSHITASSQYLANALIQLFVNNVVTVVT